MSVWFAHALFFCTFSVEACEFVTCEVPDFENATRMTGSRVVVSDKIDFITMSSMFALAHFSCSHSTPLTLTSSSSVPSPRTTCQVKLPINKPCEDHKMKSVALWLTQPLPPSSNSKRGGLKTSGLVSTRHRRLFNRAGDACAWIDNPLPSRSKECERGGTNSPGLFLHGRPRGRSKWLVWRLREVHRLGLGGC